MAPLLQQQAQIDLNDPVDPVEVIINPANPPNQDYIELNNLLEEIEENIPQLHQPVVNPLLNGGINDQQILGFPLPPLPDVLGEEIPMDQLIEQEDAPEEEHLVEQEVNNHMDEEEPVEDFNQMEVDEEDGLDLNLLVGLGEEGFPVLPNGGMQLPQNQVEMELMAIANEQLQEQDISTTTCLSTASYATSTSNPWTSSYGPGTSGQSA